MRAIIEADPLKLREKLPKNSKSTILRSFGIWSKLESWKSLISGCFMSWPQIFKKIFVLQCHWTVMSNKKWTVYTNQRRLAQWLDQERRGSKALPKATLAPRKHHGHCSMVSESQRNHYIWEVYSANRWDAPKTAMPAAGTAQQKGPNSSPWQCLTTWQVAQPALQKLNELGYSRQPATTSSSVSRSLCRENAFTTSRRQKVPSKSSSNPKVWIFALQE